MRSDPLDPDEIRLTKYANTDVYLVVRNLPGGIVYGVFLTSGLIPGEYSFSSAYKIKPDKFRKLKLEGKPIYKKNQPPHGLAKSHGGFNCVAQLQLQPIRVPLAESLDRLKKADSGSLEMFAPTKTSSPPIHHQKNGICNLPVRNDFTSWGSHSQVRHLTAKKIISQNSSKNKYHTKNDIVKGNIMISTIKNLLKRIVHAHNRTLPSGETVMVKEHSRTQKPTTLHIEKAGHKPIQFNSFHEALNHSHLQNVHPNTPVSIRQGDKILRLPHKETDEIHGKKFGLWGNFPGFDEVHQKYEHLMDKHRTRPKAKSGNLFGDDDPGMQKKITGKLLFGDEQEKKSIGETEGKLLFDLPGTTKRIF